MRIVLLLIVIFTGWWLYMEGLAGKGAAPEPAANQAAFSAPPAVDGDYGYLSAGLRPAMPVAQAYAAIPHQQTRFDPSQARMEDRQREYLTHLFTLTDAAVVERVALLKWLRNRSGEASLAGYDDMISRLKQAGPPEGLEDVHSLILDALEDQRAYYAMALADPRHHRLDLSAPEVRQSHNSLLQAYNELMESFPEEGDHNRQAFFDHLCALDFI